MEHKPANGIYKILSTGLLTGLLSILSMWLLFVRGTVSREEVSKAMLTENPYTLDRQVIQQSIIQLPLKVDQIWVEVNALKLEQVRLKAAIESLSARINVIDRRRMAPSDPDG